MGHYILGVADFDGRRGGRGRSPTCPAPMVGWACARKRPNPEFVLPARRLVRAVLPPRRTFTARKAATSGDARDGTLSGPNKIIMKLHVNWGRFSAQEIKRVLVDSGG